ncbi:hypothetical protein [Paludisphaera mucosa]|uniref:Uncharacterized protein n=1 Tax=Paludisphaera mucosa TaxID=3030827 RepID=A0ABT6FBS6_9BACT|nr:hypothetical protein [Paludisphaera mucosa]MDG3005001.1 hypothetical protein [Paludisphaera mucosa]
MASYDPDFHPVDPEKAPPGYGYDAEPRRRGCFFYGCVIAIVLSVLLMLGLALAALVAYRTFLTYRDMYTATAPVELPKPALVGEEQKRAVARIEAFRDAVEAGGKVEPLVLGGDDLNALIQESPRLKDRIYLSIVGDKIKAKVSFPLSEIKDISLTRGRFLNGEAEVRLALKNGAVKVEVVSMLVDGKELPGPVRDILGQSDIVLGDDEEDANDSEGERRYKRLLHRIASLEVKDGVMIVTPRDPEPAPTPPSEPKPAPEPPAPPQPAAAAEPKAAPAPAPPAPTSPAPTP